VRITIPLVIDMTDGQVKEWADHNGLPRNGGRLYAREVVDGIRSYVLTHLQGSALDEYADISIKR
jgi:hypothetical protein